MNQQNPLTLKSDFNEFPKLTRFLEDFGKKYSINPKALFQIIFSLEEIFNNIILYGYKSNTENEINFSIKKQDQWVTVTIEDEAAHFNPLKATKPDITGPLEEREPGGLGIYLVRSLMDRVSYKRENDKNVLIIEKDITKIMKNTMGD